MQAIPEKLWDVISLIASALIGGFVAFFLERRKQSLKIRAKLLELVEDWVTQVNRLIQIVGDDLTTIAQGLPLPANYDFRERHEVSRSLAEDTNKVMAIIKSGALQTLGHGDSPHNSAKPLSNLAFSSKAYCYQQISP